MKITDGLARALITVGGFGTIIAVSTVCLFLVAVVVPLFLPPAVEDTNVAASPTAAREDAHGELLHVVIDDYNLMAWSMYRDGRIRVVNLDDGALLDEITLPGAEQLTAWSFPQRGGHVAFGFADGSIRLGTISFKLRFINPEDAPEPLRGLNTGETARHGSGLVQMTRENQLRMLTVEVALEEPLASGSDVPIVLLDRAGDEDRPIIASLDEGGTLRVSQIRKRTNMMTQKTTLSATSGTYRVRARGERPRALKLSGLGDNAYLVWPDGNLRRYDTRRVDAIHLAEETDLTQDSGVHVTAVGFLIGKTTLLVGDSRGDVTGWFRVRAEDADTPDNLRLEQVKRMPGGNAGAVESVVSSQRKRTIAVGHVDGSVRMHNVTNERFLLEVDTERSRPVEHVVLSPRDDGLIAFGADRIWHWDIAVPHPEASLRAIFGKVWYEGYAKPEHVWQSTGGTDEFESKYGLIPLIFGTIKATFYSMLFGVPLALLAAIYTSEFLHPRMRSIVKPGVEMMASLPSVVLGFLAGLVIAPYIEDVVPTTLAALVTVPFAILLGSYFWQMLPGTTRTRFDAWRLAFLAITLPIGLYLATIAGPLAEQAFFRVDILNQTTGQLEKTEYSIKTWLNAYNEDPANPRYHSSPVGGWFILFLPLSGMLMGIVMSRVVNPALMRRSRAWGTSMLTTIDLSKFLIGAAGTIVLALLLSAAFSLFWDARGTYLGTYMQRNAMIVGFIMGFAIIPIIYTIADDAMSAVPEHLRSASLGAGATRWQTAMRIIIPTAMSGLFSAVMIGFGRAVGETMIVLMAAGNTPVMDWNIFNGFRTLSANIAVEMPEAVRDSTNYRMLFLAALVLFAMTFALNTLAEVIRLRYRKRAYQL